MQQALVSEALDRRITNIVFIHDSTQAFLLEEMDRTSICATNAEHMVGYGRANEVRI